MPKPNSKDELILASTTNFSVLLDLVDAYPLDQVNKEFLIPSLNRNIRDVLAHLHHWHLLLLDWYDVGMRGQKPDMPAKGFTWKTTPDLNIKIWEHYQNTDLETVKALLQKSYADTQELITKHSEEELFEKKRYKWTGSTSLGAYLIANTSSHYNWAIKRIKKSM